jgi:hypothetical protein
MAFYRKHCIDRRNRGVDKYSVTNRFKSLLSKINRFRTRDTDFMGVGGAGNGDFGESTPFVFLKVMHAVQDGNKD